MPDPLNDLLHARVSGEGSELSDTERRMLPALTLAFSPLHKAAFGTATGVAGALFLVLLTVVAILTPAAREFPLALLSQYFAGYS
ncbi:MAG: hypothetical protein ABIZ91_20490, partial [Gemmatimonadaceae bacterium]